MMINVILTESFTDIYIFDSLLDKGKYSVVQNLCE